MCRNENFPPIGRAKGISADLTKKHFLSVIPAKLVPGLNREPESRKAKMNIQPAVYILASKRNGTLYIGVTSDLVKRIWQHKNNMIEGFTKRYSVHQLVWYELHDNMLSAIEREKRIKEWKRKWKLDLIEHLNPNWMDLYHKLV